ncbi:MAG: hypothetical protein ACRELZ_12505 [Candidatus Rokuibacteriota bacterium]
MKWGVRLASVVVLVAWIGAGEGMAANYAQETLDRYFRIEYEVTQKATRPVVSGYVYNLHPGTPAERMQLFIEGLDASGNVVGTTSTWVLGNVPPGNRAYFSARAMPAASYRVQVLAFDWGSRGGSSN